MNLEYKFNKGSLSVPIKNLFEVYDRRSKTLTNPAVLITLGIISKLKYAKKYKKKRQTSTNAFSRRSPLLERLNAASSSMKATGSSHNTG